MRRYMCLTVLILSLATVTAAAVDLKQVYEEGRHYFRRGDYRGAVDAWTRVIQAEPSDTNADAIDLSVVYFNRGLSYKRLFLWEEAADDFSMVLGYDPNDPEALYQRGGCYNMMGLADKATADIANACELKDGYCTEKMLEEKRKRMGKGYQY